MISKDKQEKTINIPALLKGRATSSFLEQALQRAGLQPEETIRVRSQSLEIMPALSPAPLSSDERARRQRIVRRLYGIWSEEEEASFQRMRQELWSQWQPRNLP